jgi:hypothetical protein
MQFSKKPNHKWTLSTILGGALLACLATNANAAGVTVTDVTDWGTTPNEVVNMDTPYLNYSGGVYAGINDLSVFNGTSTTVYDGFCIDPFHFSSTSPLSYSEVPLNTAPKLPGTLNTYTATEIEDLWQEFFSPTMSSQSAAGLQVAIWELVSSNAVASGDLSSAQAVTFSGNTYTAAADLASLAGYSGPAADLVALTGSGQDYVIAVPGGNNNHNSVADGGTTISLLLLSLGALILARPVFMQEPATVRQS